MRSWIRHAVRWGFAFGVATLLACQSAPPVVNVAAPPCRCACESAFRATTPQIGKGCYVDGDRLICPLVRRDVDLEPAYPSEDPRCEKQEDGTIRCTVHPGD